MDWSFPESTSDDEALDEISERMREDFGRDSIAGSRITYDSMEMLEATRHIEEAVGRGNRLLVGFQTVEKLAAEANRYNALATSGVEIIGFGTGTAPSGLDGISWIELEPDRRAVENQWFLVILEPEPLAFVGYETSDPQLFGLRGISDPQKRFAGFVSDDPQLAQALYDYLTNIAEREHARI